MIRLCVLLSALALCACGKDNNAANSANGADMGGDGDVYVSLDWGDGGPGFDVGVPEQTLPVEVLGPQGASATIELGLREVNDATTAALRMRIAHLSIEDSAEVEVNGAYVLPLAAADSPFLRPTGGWAEGVVELDPRQLRNGTNYFIFRWTADSETQTGFRVVGFDVELDGEPQGLTQWDDPTAWTTTDPDPDAVERGRRYWQNRSPNGGPVCAECHTTSGADLQYYGYSDAAIAAYAEMLGYDGQEAADLTTYIRSLDVGRDGRPWVGAFQPGPNNYGAAGAGMDAIVDDAGVRAAWLGETVPMPMQWDHAAGYDPFQVPATLQVPTWNRWLPREIDFGWFDRAGGRLDMAIGAYDANPTLETAHALLDAAVAVGRELELEGEHESRIDLMRWAAVKLWDWSRSRSFYESHHGFPDEPWGPGDAVGSPPYMAEVGFAYFDAAESGVPYALEQAVHWWIAQLSADYGRGRSNGARPLSYHSFLTAAQGIASPSEMAWYYVLGSWEESKGSLIDMWGTADGPVRLLPPALPHVPDDLVAPLWRRFVEREAEHAIGGGTFTAGHIDLFIQAWNATCQKLDDNTREQVVARTPDEIRGSLLCE